MATTSVPLPHKWPSTTSSEPQTLAMGMCASCEAGTPATAKVILYNGELREFARPVKAAHLLDKEGSAWFICDADVMDFDGFVTAVDVSDELRPGQLYFVLPVAMLRKPLQAEQIAALAAKASSALVHTAPTDKRRSRRQSALVFAEPAVAQPAMPSKRLSGKGRSKYAMSLSAIPE